MPESSQDYCGLKVNGSCCRITAWLQDNQGSNAVLVSAGVRGEAQGTDGLMRLVFLSCYLPHGFVAKLTHFLYGPTISDNCTSRTERVVVLRCDTIKSFVVSAAARGEESNCADPGLVAQK